MKSQSLSPSNKFFELIIQANQLRQKKEYRCAINIYNTAIEIFGKSTEVIRALAICYFQLGLYESSSNEPNFQSAISLNKEAIKLASNDDLLHTDLGQIYSLGTLEYSIAAQEFRTAIGLNPTNIQALLGGVALYGVPEEVVTLSEAITWLEKVIFLEPNNPIHHFRLGKLYYENGQLKEAKSEWLKALLCPLPLDESHAQLIEQCRNSIID